MCASACPTGACGNGSLWRNVLSFAPTDVVFHWRLDGHPTTNHRHACALPRHGSGPALEVLVWACTGTPADPRCHGTARADGTRTRDMPARHAFRLNLAARSRPSTGRHDPRSSTVRARAPSRCGSNDDRAATSRLTAHAKTVCCARWYDSASARADGRPAQAPTPAPTSPAAAGQLDCDLAARCDTVLASDSRPVRLRSRDVERGLPHVTIEQHRLPTDGRATQRL